MKVLIIGPAYPLRGGGMATFNERMARAFMQNGYPTSIYTFSLQYPSFIFPGTSQYSTEAAPSDLDITVAINSINPFNWLKIGNRIKKLQPDLIIVRYWLPLMGPCLGTILRRVKKNNHTKIICVADNIIPHENRLGDKLFTKYFIKPIDAFITMSEKVLGDLRTFTTHKKAILVPHPLYDNFGKKVSKEEARKILNINNDEKILLFFGFIRKYKGLDILLEAIKIVKETDTVSNFKLLIAGEFYENRKFYDDLIEQLGIQNHLILHTDFIETDKVKNYFCAADVVIQPYRNATQSGVTPLAYHFEKPMIVTNVGGLPQMVLNGKVGLVAKPTATSLAENITTYFQKGEAHFLPYLLEEKKKLSWNKMVESILALAKQI